MKYAQFAWVKNSLRHRMKQATQDANLAQKAYQNPDGYMYEPSKMLAAAHREVAEVYRKHLEAVPQPEDALPSTDRKCKECGNTPGEAGNQVYGGTAHGMDFGIPCETCLTPAPKG